MLPTGSAGERALTGHANWCSNIYRAGPLQTENFCSLMVSYYARASTGFWGILRPLRSEILSGNTMNMSVRGVEEVSAQVPADDFLALEEKVYRTIELYKAAREARGVAERDIQRLRQQVEEREEEVESLKKEVISLRREREEVRNRVEKMLRQIEAISDETAAAG
jgi:predicted RNase H-like nuclease (RuvC/YqgF family)